MVEQQPELEKAAKLAYLGTMAFGLAHEMSQPIGIIRATTSAALDDIHEKLFQPFLAIGAARQQPL